MADQNEQILSDPGAFLVHLKSNYHIYHLSNVFFRDVHYGVMSYLEAKGSSIGYQPAESLARKVIALLEARDVLRPLDSRTWLLNYPEYRAVSAKPAPAARPAAPAKPAAAPAQPSPVA